MNENVATNGFPVKHKSKLFNSKRSKFLLVITIFVISIALSLFINEKYFGFAETDLCRGKSTSPIYKEAAKVLNPTASTKLRSVVTKIEKMKNYDKDPNCLYPIVVYYMNISDSKAARPHFNKLESLTGSDKYLSSDYSVISYSNSEIKTNLDQLDKIFEQASKNFPGQTQ